MSAETLIVIPNAKGLNLKQTARSFALASLGLARRPVSSWVASDGLMVLSPRTIVAVYVCMHVHANVGLCVVCNHAVSMYGKVYVM